VTAYERVRVRPDDGRAPFTVTLRDPAVVGGILTGIEVDREGTEVAPRGVDERRHIISVDLVTRRTPLVMDNHTGLLTEPGDRLSAEG